VSVETEDIGTLRKKLSITVPRDLIDERRHEQFTELKREAQVDGFRRGRAPLRLIEKRFGRDVADEMTGPLIGSAFMAAVEKEELKDKTIGDPRVWVKVPEERPGESGRKETVLADKLLEIDKAIEHIHLPGEGPLTFACEVELRPEFDLPSLEKIPLTRPSAEITDELVESEVDRLRAMRGQYVPVEEGGVEADDVIVADYVGTVGDRVVAQEANHSLAARDQRLAGIQVEGLGDALVGKSLEEKVEIEATVPDDYEDGELRGQPARFELTIRDIKRLRLPEIDQEFLSAYGADGEADLRKMVRQDLEINRRQMVQQRMRADLRKYLLENTKLEIPSGLSQRQTDRAITRRMMEMYRLGFPQPEIEKRIDDLRASAAEEAVSDLKVFFVMEKIAAELEVSVSEEELNSAIAAIAQRRSRRFDRVRDELSRGGGIESLYVQIRDEKIMDRLIQDADVTDAPAEPPKKKKKTARKAKKAKSTKKAQPDEHADAT
ncbi:MAG: trigger factor, partial [Planctomycetota bacterium]